MINGISSKALPARGDTALPEKLLLRYGGWDGCCVLKGGENILSDGARRFVCLEPVLRVHADDRGSFVTGSSGAVKRFSGIWDALSWLAEGLENSGARTLPVAAGFLSYELLHHIEDVSRPNADPFNAPLYAFYVYRKIVECGEDGAALHTVGFAESYEPFWRADPALETSAVSPAAAPPAPIGLCEGMNEELSRNSSMRRADYLAAVTEIRRLISKGEVYQVNLTQRFCLPCEASPVSYYLALERVSPGRYGGFLNVAGEGRFDGFALASASPELFLCSDGTRLLTSPIKGSRARSSVPAEDAAARADLEESAKDRAELAMIVDLERNDLGRVARVGSVRVESHARIDELPYAYHLVSDVSAERDGKKSFVEVIKALFPCGSITGAPKIAAMRTIANLESSRRGVYSGAFGFIGTGGACQFNVAIRTAVMSAGQIFFQTGGGIVIDSIPELEYEEALFKARGLWRALLEIHPGRPTSGQCEPQRARIY